MYSHLAHSRSMTILLEGTSKRGSVACEVSSSVPDTFGKHRFLMLLKLLETTFKLIMRHDQKHTGLLEWMTFFILLIFYLYIMVFILVFLWV